MEHLSTWVMIGLIVYQGVMVIMQRRDHRKVEADLLNRMMSRNFTEYTQGTVKLREEDVKDKTVSEIIDELGDQALNDRVSVV